MRADIVPGATFPDYELSDHTGTRRTLSSIQGVDPMVIVLSRGGFCPKDRRQHEGLVQLWREMKPGIGYCAMVTVSTDTIVQSNEFRAAIDAGWPFLSDAGRHVQRDLDIVEYTDSGNNPMIPHVVVCAPGLLVHKVYNGYWFFGRPTSEELRQDLREVLRSHRWDYDLSDAEVRAAWERGEKDRFYPYGGTYRQALLDISRRGG